MGSQTDCLASCFYARLAAHVTAGIIYVTITVNRTRKM